MLFITNRYPRQSIRSRANRRFDFDLSNNGASNSVFFCNREAADKYIEIGSRPFLKALKESGYRQLLIYLHGFSNPPESVFTATEELQALCDSQSGKAVLVVPLVWPCDDDAGIVRDYWDDQKSADMSAFAFARVLNKFIAWRNSEQDNPQSDPCIKRINLLAHSMGNRVLRQTLLAWNKYDLSDGVPLIFRNTFMVAADVVNETLQFGQDGEHICHASRNVVVYHASDDLALRASKASNLKNKIASRRLGHTGPESLHLTPHNVYSLDCDDINNRYDFPKGHTYFRYSDDGRTPGLVFQHIFRCIDTGRVFPDEEARRTRIITDN